MSLRDRISAIFKSGAPKPTPTTADEGAPPRSVDSSALAERFAAEQGRAQIVGFSRKMYEEDPRVEGILSDVARDAVKGGFTVKTGDARAEESAQKLIKRLKLGTHLVDWVRLTFRDGDSLIEIGVDEGRQITSATRKPTLAMRRHSNRQDRFDDPTRAFWYSEHSWDITPPPEALWFAEWQIVHARWDHDEGSRYGSPLFASADSPYKRVKEGELDIAVRRKTRAGMKYLHVVEGADQPGLDAYKENNKQALDNPFAMVADFFSNKPGSITTVQGDMTLGNIDDVMHHLRTFWVASPVPMSLVGYGQDLNRDVLDKQKEQYDEELSPITEWIETDIVKPLLERQWLLDGILPEGLGYEIEWQPKTKLSSQDLLNVSQAALTLRTLGFGDEAIVSILQRFLPGIDVRAALNAGTNAPNEASASRLADEMDATEV